MDDVAVIPSTPMSPMLGLSPEVAAEIQSVQAQVIMAKQFPRNEKNSREQILMRCNDVNLAERAVYAYKRGGTIISGPSIRLAETIARSWGNLAFGSRQLSQYDDRSEMLSYAWDLETNTRRELRFIVKHERHTKKGVNKLHDPRDIYENNMNQAARRLRKCILDLIPGDLIDSAVEASKKAVENSPDLAKKKEVMLKMFEKHLNVTSEMIEKRLGHSLKAMMPSEFVALRTIMESLRDGASNVEDWFELPSDPEKINQESKKSAKEAAKKQNAKDEPQKRDIALSKLQATIQIAADNGIDIDDALGTDDLTKLLSESDSAKLETCNDILAEIIKKRTKNAGK